ncbi:MAG: pilus assembly protein [Lachnospiraceae bacterium]|nr:pilus assembly protein [Lachnospiraceae bacterium]
MEKNRGSATVEACLVVPVFLFFMLAVAGIFMVLLAEAHIHQSLAEAANYTAQNCYLEKKLLSQTGQTADHLVDTAVLYRQFHRYLGEDAYVERMIQNGKKGILVRVEPDSNNPKIFTAEADYVARISVPVFGSVQISLCNRIQKKAFLGYSKEEKMDRYVYVTPNQAVYHVSRNCTHLVLSIQQKSGTQRSHYSPCSFCGKSGEAGDPIYVAKTGEVYHYRRDCSGLKRTVTRIKLREAGGLSPCSRCGRNR